MSYSCITSWRLDQGYSNADEQPPGYITPVQTVSEAK